MRTIQELNSLALRTRRMWNEDSYSPIDIFALVNSWKEKRITVIKYPMSSRISGICTRESEDIIICINSAISYGRQRFTLAHELYHMLYQKDIQTVVCDMSINGDKSESELEADRFAGYLLMPYDALLEYEHCKSEWSLEKIIDAEQFFQISHQAMIYRLLCDNLIDREAAEEYKAVRVAAAAARRGYGRELYMPTDRSRQYFTTGEYIRKVESIASKDLISEGKKEELLLEAYRADIVYDFDGEEAEPND